MAKKAIKCSNKNCRSPLSLFVVHYECLSYFILNEIGRYIANAKPNPFERVFLSCLTESGKYGVFEFVNNSMISHEIKNYPDKDKLCETAIELGWVKKKESKNDK